MKHLLLPVKRSFNARAYLILLGLLVPAEIAIQPYALTLTGITSPRFWNLVLGAGIDLLLVALLGAAGLWIASQIGLGCRLSKAGQSESQYGTGVPVLSE